MRQKNIKNLLIVESPAKAHTIEGYLGKDWVVMASVGHIRSIAKKTVDGVKPIDTDKDFYTHYEIDPEKKKTVSELKKAIKSAENVWLATDEDREGESIAWHLCQALNLDVATTKRIVFHEITKEAIDQAIKNPRLIDMNLVKAQQARQILDRLVGFELSPVVWRKVPGGKSAGRVQSPAVRLLVEREREIAKFKSNFNFKVTAEFNKLNSDETLKAQFDSELDNEEEVQDFLEQLKAASYTVADVTSNKSSRRPLPPFTTSTMQQDANAKLGYSARTTMSLAQSLYQAGFITYMRTDSLNLSNQAIKQAGDYIKNTYGANYHNERHFKTKAAGAQEAHEAIRPTDIRKDTLPVEPRAQKLYSLIRGRTLASQMADAKIERTTVKIDITKNKRRFIAKGEVLVFDGFLKVYGSAKDEILPKLSVGDALINNVVTARQVFARPPARYSEGSLVKKLEELEIGRPSTYATIISTIQTRGYAKKGDSEGEERDVIEFKLLDSEVTRQIVKEKTGSTKGKLVPTASGVVVADFLSDYFSDIVDYAFTANIEHELDEIANSRLDKVKMLGDFYKPFHQKIKGSDAIERSKVAGKRLLGKDPKTNEPVFARMGRFGPLLQMGDNDDPKKKVRFANFPKGATLDSINFAQAIEMFELPRKVGVTEAGEEIIANIGRFGPYIKVGAKFVSIKPLSPFEIDEAKARELYSEKLAADAKKQIADFGDVKILNGRFGAYITNGDKNVKIPKDLKAEEISEKQARKILEEAPDKPKRGRRISKKSSKKS